MMMSKRKRKSKRKIRKDCERKRKYDTQKIAQNRANFLNKIGVRIKPYQCPNCGGWHLCKRDKGAVVREIFKKLK